MERAIQIHFSKLDLVFHGLAFSIAGYWLWVTDISLLLRLIALSTIAIYLVHLYFREINQLVGDYQLSNQGQLVVVSSLYLEEGSTYILLVRQRLPWCLDVQLESKGERRRQLIWVDSLSTEHWRRLRVFLSEECQQRP